MNQLPTDSMKAYIKHNLDMDSYKRCQFRFPIDGKHYCHFLVDMCDYFESVPDIFPEMSLRKEFHRCKL